MQFGRRPLLRLGGPSALKRGVPGFEGEGAGSGERESTEIVPLSDYAGVPGSVTITRPTRCGGGSL